MNLEDRLRKAEEKAATRHRPNSGPLVVIVYPDTCAGDPRIDGRGTMTVSQADAYRRDLAARRAGKGPLFIHLDAQDINL